MKKSHLVFVSVFLLVFGFTKASDYSIEYKNAYNYARSKGITTVSSIDKANLSSSITRIEMAKMISVFSINVLGLIPDTTKNCNFYDVSPDLDRQYNNGVTRVCQLGLMGIYNNGERADYFDPNNKVTRGQWATILSRALNKVKGKEIENGDPFYQPHLNYLLSKGIIDDYAVPSPKFDEKRGNVMLMMYKADPENVVVTDYKEGYSKMKPGQTYRNEYYGFQISSLSSGEWIVDIEKSYMGNESGLQQFNVYYYVFIPEKFGDYELVHDYQKEYQENAKSFSESGLLLLIDSREIIKYGSDEYLYIFEGWNKLSIPRPTSKEYVLLLEPGYSIQESPYVYIGKGEEKEGYRNVFWNIVGDYQFVEK